jgi:hypothetical protein
MTIDAGIIVVGGFGLWLLVFPNSYVHVLLFLGMREDRKLKLWAMRLVGFIFILMVVFLR